jgi:hypothetical protein
MSCSLCFRSISALFYGASTNFSNRSLGLNPHNDGLRTFLVPKTKEISIHAGWSELAP